MHDYIREPMLKKAGVFFLCFMWGFMLKAQHETDPESEFILFGRHYIPDSPWWTIGTGYGYNFSEKVFEPNLLIDVHFRVKEKHYFGVGFLTSREQFLDNETDAFFLPHAYNNYSLNSFHAMYGWRGENIKHNYAFYFGPAINWGYDYQLTDASGIVFHRPYLEPGVYMSLQYSRKLFYDLGLGLSLWSCLNKSYQVAGLTLHFYFSTAFKREL